ncbi:DUF5134 domain-containing protein [Streptomyces avicenniae]|uniref:DUF5134 domain-containing protein n=1 Tax=Streptomyces avicenniae TaxID=500153 RepID=UPI000699931C|nr:DUF5134 domain-containing protein [Streptomyces avicenniae]
MHGPVLVGWLLVALCGGTGAYCLLRMRGAVGAVRQAAGAEAAMGLLMGVMALPALPATAAVALALGAVSGAVALWSGLLLASGVPHRTHHVVEGLAMVYMAVAMASGGGHGGAHGPAGTPVLTGGLLAYFVLYALRCGPLLLPGAAGTDAGAGAVRVGSGARGAVAAPEVTAACRLALAAGMAVMLLSL